jgi:hypothetical protein
MLLPSTGTNTTSSSSSSSSSSSTSSATAVGELVFFWDWSNVMNLKLPYFSVDNACVIYTKKLKFDKIRTCALYIRKRHEGSQIQ